MFSKGGCIKRFGVIVTGVFLVTSFLVGKVVTQTDWHGGPGTPGPVEEWGTCFEGSRNSNYLYEYGRLSLAAEMNSDPVDHFISDEPGYSVETGDMDYDGDIDVVTAGEWNGRVVWFENTDGAGTFTGIPNVILYAYEPEFHAADVDQDGYTDILYNDEIRLYCYRNNHDGTFSKNLVGDHLQGDATGVADFDNDGDIDIVSAGRGDHPALYWFENEGACNFTRHEISSSYSGPDCYIPTGDFDADGFVDFVISGEEDAQLDWWGDKKGPVSREFEPHNLATDYDKDFHSCFVWIADIEKDGDLDILATASLDNSLDWWENDGAGNFTRHNITSAAQMPQGVAVLDMDYDGDYDVVTASKNGNYLRWWENDGAQNFTRHNFPAGGYNNAWAVWTGDISGNGFADIVSVPGGAGPPSSSYWWELFDRFVSPAELTSSIYDARTPVVWDRIEWSAQLNAGGKVGFLVRTTNDIADWPGWSTCDTIETPTYLNPYIDQNTRYLHYKVILSTTNGRYSPFLYEVRFIYSDAATEEIEEILKTSYQLRIKGSVVHYALPPGKTAQLVVFDASGRRVEAKQVADAGCFDLVDLSAGLYFVRLEHEQGTITRKLVNLR